MFLDLSLHLFCTKDGSVSTSWYRYQSGDWRLGTPDLVVKTWRKFGKSLKDDLRWLANFDWPVVSHGGFSSFRNVFLIGRFCIYFPGSAGTLCPALMLCSAFYTLQIKTLHKYQVHFRLTVTDIWLIIVEVSLPASWTPTLREQKKNPVCNIFLKLKLKISIT